MKAKLMVIEAVFGEGLDQVFCSLRTVRHWKSNVLQTAGRALRLTLTRE